MAMVRAATPAPIIARPMIHGTIGCALGAAPGTALRCSRNWKIVKPKPISAAPVRTHDIKVRSRLRRVRSHEKCESEVMRTSNRSGPTAIEWSLIVIAPIIPAGRDLADDCGPGLVGLWANIRTRGRARRRFALARELCRRGGRIGG